MIRFAILALPLLLAPSRLQERKGGATTDPDKYRIILENERVRVLEYTDKPGDRTRQHYHPDFVLYALSDFERTLHFPDGRKVSRAFRKGDVISMKGQTHIGEDVGKTPTHVLIVELKEPPRDTAR